MINNAKFRGLPYPQLSHFDCWASLDRTLTKLADFTTNLGRFAEKGNFFGEIEKHPVRKSALEKG